RPARLYGPTHLECLGLCFLVVLLVGLNRPRVDALVRGSVAPLYPSELAIFPIARLQTSRATALLVDRAQWQRRSLRRLDQCEQTAARAGWGRDAIRGAFGHRFIPGGVNMSALPQRLYDQYDAAALLNLPERGTPANPAAVRAALSELYAEEPE